MQWHPQSLWMPVMSQKAVMENGGNSYRIRSEEKRNSAGVRAGCQSCEGQIWGGLVPGRCRWVRCPPAEQRVLGGSAAAAVWAGRHRQPLLPAAGSSLWKKPGFSPKRLPRGTGNVCSLSPAKAKPYPCPQCSAWVSQGCSWRLAPSLQRFHCLSPSFFHSFPPLLPPLPCALAERPPHGPAATATPLNGPRRRIIAIAHLHSPSYQSSPAPPFSKSQLPRCAEPRGLPGHPGMASAGRATEPGLA